MLEFYEPQPGNLEKAAWNARSSERVSLACRQQAPP
jgi:hypothetical protein